MRQANSSNSTEMIMPNDILDQIEQAIADVSFGSVTLILQDARVLQMEKLDKIRFAERKAMPGNTVKDNKAQLRARIIEAVRGLEYGQVVILIKDGRVTQIERTQKQRVVWVEGRYGDGI